MTYKITAHTSKGNLTVEVESESKFLALDLAQHYSRAAFGDDFTITHETTEDTKQYGLLNVEVYIAQTHGK